MPTLPQCAVETWFCRSLGKVKDFDPSHLMFVLPWSNIHIHKSTDKLDLISIACNLQVNTVTESLAHFNVTMMSSQSKLALLVNLPSSY